MKVSPSLEEVMAYRGPATHVALRASVVADADTPVSAFRKLVGDVPRSFLLESVVGQEHLARYSMFGRADAGSEVIDEVAPGRDPLAAVRERLTGRVVWCPEVMPRFFSGAVGYVGFDAIAAFEPGVPLPAARGAGLPACAFLFADEVYVYDHARRRLLFHVLVTLGGDREATWRAAAARMKGAFAGLATSSLAEPPWDVDAPTQAVDVPIHTNRTREDFEDAVERARKAIFAGEIFKSC